MQSFTIELVSNASVQVFSDKTLSFLQTFYRSNWIWKVNGNLEISKKISNPSLYQIVTEGKVMFFDKNLSE